MDVGNGMYWAPNHSGEAQDSDQKQFLFSGIFVSTPKAEGSNIFFDVEKTIYQTFTDDFQFTMTR